jgi:protocatechuate 3,4-dioxygenase beta subunit
MERKEFIKQLGFGTLIAPVVIVNDSHVGKSLNACEEWPRETPGPFPTKDPEKLLIADIRGDRSGIEMKVRITIQNKNNNCRALPGALVDIWHCDKDGYYSEYGGSGMQRANLQSVHFLRGRQQADKNGLVSFTTIFPGWYRGRAPHIHVEIFNGGGKSLLITQIAFPTKICDAVYTKATQYYTRGRQDTSNESDGVFANSLADQLASVSGNIENGFVLSNTIIVNA